MGNTPRYWAFLSYSHADKRWAKWLHRALEGYSIPKNLVGRTCAEGVIPKKLQPIFRDRDELPVSTDLSAAVRTALQDSRYLIVLCSPDAARSEWVNQEILEFKAARGAENILCAIVGEPSYLAGASADSNEHLFPQSLKGEAGNIEPMAADLRSDGDGKRAGMLKLVAGMLGLGLDDLVQRDLHRRQRRLMAITVASATGMAVMGLLALSAINSQRDEAIQKAQAEELVEFMLGDLHDKLKPVGSLDTLASLSERALRYYASLKPGDLTAEDKKRRARALLAIGEIENLRGDIGKAAELFGEAFGITAELLAASPNESTRVFDHAQSVYWLGFADYQHGRFDEAEAAFVEYSRLSARLVELEPDNAAWRAELASAFGNLGILQLGRGRTEPAFQSLSAGRDILLEMTGSQAEDAGNLFLLVNTNAWIADIQESKGNNNAALEGRLAQTSILDKMRLSDPNDTKLSLSMVGGSRALGRLSLGRGDFEAAEQHLSNSVDLGRTLLQLDPSNTQWSSAAGGALLAYADMLLWQDRQDEARGLISEASEIIRWLTEQDANVLSWQLQLTFPVELSRARLARIEGDPVQALERLKLATDNLSLLAGQHPDNRNISSLLAATHFHIGEILASSGQLEEATGNWRQTVRRIESEITQRPLADRATLALAYLRLGQVEQASTQAAELEALGFRHPMTRELRQRAEARSVDSD